MTKFLKDNWFWVLIIGVFLGLYISEKVGRSIDAEDNRKIINKMIERYEEDKGKIDQKIISIDSSISKTDSTIDKSYNTSLMILEEIKKIKNERTEVSDNVPSLSERKLDSIITNYRHK